MQRLQAPSQGHPEGSTRNIRCFGCGKRGHRVYDCPEYEDKIKKKRGRKPVKCFFCGEDHFVVEFPKRNEPGFDINTVIDKWDEYRQTNTKGARSDRTAEAKQKDALHQASKWMLGVKLKTRDNIGESYINTLLDLIEDDDWVLEWPHDHLHKCTIGGLQSETEMQALSTHIQRKILNLKVEGCGRLHDYKEGRAMANTPAAAAGMSDADSARAG